LILFVLDWLREGALTLTEPQKNFSLAQEGPNDSSDNMAGTGPSLHLQTLGAI